MDRHEDLVWLRETVMDSIREASPDKRAPLVNQLRLIVAELAELNAPASQEDSDVLIDFRTELNKRRRAASDGSHGT